ncbi:MAG: LuxR C-terminal-related transcriptional regulator [Ktedonobacterales bacterium]
MPRSPLHALIWSRDQGLYELSTQGQVVHHFQPRDEAAWLTWLGEVTSLAFHGPSGSLNVYQETRPRGGRYWYAYHTDRDGIRKRYLGRTAKVSLAHLEETARILSYAPTPPIQADAPAWVPPSPETELGLLETRLSPPRLPNALVSRTILLAALDGAFSSPVTLVSASAGWGKTTLLSSWASRHPDQIAWLALDALDIELTRFWTAVIAALRTRVPGVGVLALAMLHAPQPPSVSVFVTALLNDLAEAGNEGAPLLLLLDDYHVIDDPAIQESVTFWVEHLPAHVHLLLCSRVDPDLPLSRWRARGQLLELRTADLGFDPEEAGRFLRQAMGLHLSEDEVAALARRTEGWVAGLQLAALSLRSHEDHAEWIANFTGSHRFVLDYVQHEILQRQPLPLQRFLLQIAVLTRMNAALCQAVTGEAASQEILETLERSNLFVVPLDDERHWYRLHDLFREALLGHGQASQPDLPLPQVHVLAAHWYEQHGEVREAIVHALAAPDYYYAARLLEKAAPALVQSGEAQSLLTWLAALPDVVLSSQACVVLDTVLHLSKTILFTVQDSYVKRRALVEQVLGRLETLVELTPAASREDEESVPALPEEERAVVQRRLRLLRVLIAAPAIVLRGDAEGLHQLVQELEVLDAGEEMRWKIVRLFLTFLLTETLQTEGALLIQPMLEAKRTAQEASDYRSARHVIFWLASAYRRAGQLRRCEQECWEGLALAEQTGLLFGVDEGYLYSFLAHMSYAWNRLDEAARSAHQTLQIGKTWQHAHLLLSGQLALARIALARGDLAAADQALQQAEAWVQQERLSRYREVQVGAVRVRYWLAAGELETARQWAEQMGTFLETGDPPQNSAVLMQVRVWLAHRQYTLAIETLQRWRAHLDRPANRETTSGYLALSVVALHHTGQGEQAQAFLARLLALTDPEGNIRVYLDEGDPMKQVLVTLLAPLPEPTESSYETLRPWRSFVSTLLAAFEREEQRANAGLHEEPALVPAPAGSLALGVPLTRREQDVLCLLAEGASNQEIAQALVIQVSTVKKHGREDQPPGEESGLRHPATTPHATNAQAAYVER